LRISAHLRSLPPETFPATPDRAHLTHPDTINIVGGGPAVDALPVELVARASATLMETAGAQALLGYGVPLGDPGLREQLATLTGAPLDRILVTNGAMHGVELAMLLLLERGARVAIENPTFPGTVSLLHLHGIEPVFINTSETDGLDIDALEERLEAGERFDAVYTIPDYLNPTGAVMPAANRTRLVKLADRFDFAVIVDNPYREARLEGDPVDDFDLTHDRVVYIGAFTKTLGAGLRVGWLIAPEHIVSRGADLRKRNDFQSSSFAQHLVTRVLEHRNEYLTALEAGRERYRLRRGILAAPFLEHAETLELKLSRGGFFLWPRITGGPEQATRLRDALGRAGVLSTGGAGFGPPATISTASASRTARRRPSASPRRRSASGLSWRIGHGDSDRCPRGPSGAG